MSNTTPGAKETVLCSVFSRGWEREMPVKFIRYKGGAMDVHCQTGDHYEAAMKKADESLKGMGLRIDPDSTGWIGPTGVYRRVIRIKRARTSK